MKMCIKRRSLKHVSQTQCSRYPANKVHNLIIFFDSRILRTCLSQSSRQNPRQVCLVAVSKQDSSAPAAVKNAREASLSVQGSRLFNLLPRHIDTGTTNQFKMELASWWESFSDQPINREQPKLTLSLTKLLIAAYKFYL